MAKKDIGKILTTGSPKQRLLLLAEDTARAKYSQERLLTDHEINQLSESFKKPNEIQLWNKWLKVDRVVTSAITNLQGLKFEVFMHYSNLRGYILVWETIQEAEVLTNHILHEIKDQEERIKISSQAGKLGRFLFTDIQTDKEGYLDINIDFEKERPKGARVNDPDREKRYSLWYVMNNVKKEAINSAIKFLSWREAILDYMEEEGFTIKTYKDIINLMTEGIHKPIIGWTKYQSDEESFKLDIPKDRADKLKAKYAITPNTRELEVDTEIYNYFKKEFLRPE
mgnify:CR=1 FL=1|jgi:hypothetical protein